MGRNKGKGSGDAMRRFQQGSAQRAEASQVSERQLLRSLEDPQQFGRALGVFGQLALVLPSLTPLRFPIADFVAGLVAEAEACALEPGPERLIAIRQALVPKLASEELLARSQATIRAAQLQTEDADALLALTAAGMIATGLGDDTPSEAHPFWEVLFQVSLADAVLSGALLAYVALESLPTALEPIQSAFARALAQGDAARLLDELGVSGATPASLAQAYRAALQNPYHLQLDGVLHLTYAHVEIASGLGREIAALGVPRGHLEQVVARWRVAYERDATEGLRRDVKSWLKKRLEQLRDDPEPLAEAYAASGLEAEQLRSAAALLGLTVLEPEDDVLLQAVHVQSLQRSRVAVREAERGFVEKLWGQPSDTFALEEYERFLTSCGDATRSRRVHRFRDWVRAQAQSEEASGE